MDVVVIMRMMVALSALLFGLLGHTKVACSNTHQGMSDDSGIEEDDPVPAESLESDLDLKLHVLGHKMLWTQPWPHWFSLLVLSSLNVYSQGPAVQLRFVDANLGKAPSMLPTRFLPPSNIWMLHSQCPFKVSLLVCIKVLWSSCATNTFGVTGWAEVQPLCTKI